MKNDAEKAEEIIRKRDLAAKGLKPRRDGKPVDPMVDADALDIDKDPVEPKDVEEREKEIADRSLGIGLGLRR